MKMKRDKKGNALEKSIFTLAFLWLTSLTLLAQNITVKGNVVDEQKEPLIGVSVKIQGTTTGTVTDYDGNFELPNVPPTEKLEFSYVGMKTLVVPVDGRTVINVTMQEDVEMLEEVVVVGYGTQRKATLTGSVSTVNSEKILERSVSTLSTALQGIMPGVTIQQTSGQPGSGSQIRVRGIGSINSNSDPLVLVDGIEMDINQVDPNTIDNISVLKDAASASIYGSRASNGVILITTKKGKTNKITTTYNGYISTQKPTNMPIPVSAWEYLQAELNAWDNAGITVTDAQRQQQLQMIENQKKYKPDNWNRYDTNWKEETIKDNSLMQSHNISIGGNSEKINFFAAGTYLYQDGLIPNDHFDRTNIRINSNIKIFQWANVDIQTNLRESKTLTPGLSTPKSIINTALYMLPTLSAAKELDGNWGYGKNGLNPVAIANASGENILKTTETLVSGTLNLNPMKGLDIIAQYSQRKVSNRGRNLITPYLTSLKGQILGTYPAEDGLTESWNETIRNYYRMQASYSSNFDKHQIDALIGLQSEDNNYSNFYGSKKEFELGKYYLDNGNGATATSGGGANSWAMTSLYGRINYNYNEKYLFELTGRYDGSSRFVKENRWGFFPSISGGWVISKEAFMVNTQDYLDILKLRISYGLLGNQNIGNYPYTAVISPGYGYYLGDNKEIASGVAQTNLSNPNIKWEKSKQLNAGVDVSFWNGLLSMTVDLYKKDIYDMLMKFPLPYYAGMGPAFTNAGDMTNKGWEIMIKHNHKIQDLSYGVTFTLSDNRNKITNLNGLNSQDKTMVESYPFNGIWGYLSDGYYADWDDVANSPKLSNAARPGFVKYKKIYSGEGVDPLLIDSRDQAYLGDPFPHYEYGLTGNILWKGIDLNIFFQGIGKRSNFMSGVGLKPFANGANLFRHQMDSWTPDNPNAEYPILVPEANSADNFVKSDKWVRDASYLRLKNVVLGYTLPKFKTQNVKLRFYISGDNLFTISKFYKGYDPEVSYGGTVGGEFYPIMQTYTFGVNLEF